MDFSPPTTADYAYSEARAANLTNQDAIVLIGWLAKRCAMLERRLGEITPGLPALPSKMNGFACIPHREKAVHDAFQAMINKAIEGE